MAGDTGRGSEDMARGSRPGRRPGRDPRAMSSEPRPVSPAMVAAALLRTGAWLYAALWVVVTAAAPWGPPGLLPVVCLAPLGPLVFLAVMRSMQRAVGEGHAEHA